MVENLYQRKINDQFDVLFRHRPGGHYYPILGSFYDLEERLREMPLWAQSFNDKDISPLDAQMFHYYIVDSKTLKDILELHEGEKMSLPPDEVRIEREIIQDSNKAEVLIERLYYIWSDESSELAWITFLTPQDRTGYKSKDRSILTSQSLHSGGQMGASFQVISLKEELTRGIPLLLVDPDANNG